MPAVVKTGDADVLEDAVVGRGTVGSLSAAGLDSIGSSARPCVNYIKATRAAADGSTKLKAMPDVEPKYRARLHAEPTLPERHSSGGGWTQSRSSQRQGRSRYNVRWERRRCLRRRYRRHRSQPGCSRYRYGRRLPLPRSRERCNRLARLA